MRVPMSYVRYANDPPTATPVRGEQNTVGQVPTTSPGGDMGARGPVPKRSDQRVRRNKAETPIEKVEYIGAVEIPPLNFDDPHPLTKDLYESLGQSAQARYYEPSDYQLARSVLHFLDQQFKSGRPSGQMIAALFSQLTDLLVSEGARRRCRLEVERAQAGGDLIDVADIFRKRLAEG